MAAPNLTALFDFEGQFESATQGILTASGITNDISQQGIKEELINTGIALDVNPAIDELTQIPAPLNWPVGQPPPQEYFRYTGNLELRVEVARDLNAEDPGAGVDTMMSTIRGKLRALMMRCCMPYTDVNLPYYRVSDIKPNGTTTGFDSARNIDVCSLRFIITWAIKPTAWPAWVES